MPKSSGKPSQDIVLAATDMEDALTTELVCNISGSDRLFCFRYGNLISQQWFYTYIIQKKVSTIKKHVIQNYVPYSPKSVFASLKSLVYPYSGIHCLDVLAVRVLHI